VSGGGVPTDELLEHPPIPKMQKAAHKTSQRCLRSTLFMNPLFISGSIEVSATFENLREVVSGEVETTMSYA
jgi:hypothetical protein